MNWHIPMLCAAVVGAQVALAWRAYGQGLEWHINVLVGVVALVVGLASFLRTPR